MSQCDVFFSAVFRTREEPVRRHPCPPAEATTRGRERYEFQNRFACCRPRHWHGSFCTSVHRHPHWPDLLRCLLLTKADISQVMDNLPPLCAGFIALTAADLSVDSVIPATWFGVWGIAGIRTQARLGCRCGFPTTPFQKSEKTHKQSGSPHRSSWSRNSLATWGRVSKYLLAHLLRRRAYGKVRVDKAWSCGRDA